MKLNIENTERERLKTLPKSVAAALVRERLPLVIKNLETVLLSKNGQLVSIALNRVAKVRKTSPLLDKVRKESRFTVQADIEYTNKAAVIAAHESGKREKRGLPEATLALSKVLRYNLNTDNAVFAFGTIKNPACKRSTVWTVDGKTVNKSDIEGDLLASEIRPSDGSDWLYLDPDNIMELK